MRAPELSNSSGWQIADVLSVAYVCTAVLKVEYHPGLAQNELIAHCQTRNLKMTSYSLLGSSDHAWCHPDEPVLLGEQMIFILAEKACLPA